MSILRADSIRDRAGTGAPDFPNGLTSGTTLVATATTATLANTATVATNAEGLTGTPNITVGTVTGTDATFSGNLTVQGTTTTIDTAVTSVDSLAVDGSVGIGTTNPNVDLHLHDSTNTRIQFTDDSVGAGAGDGVIIGLNGDDDFFINNRESGKKLLLFTNNIERVQITGGGTAIFKAGLAEKFQTGTTIQADPTIALSDSNIVLRTSNESGNQAINFTGVHSTLAAGEAVSFTVIITPNGSGAINNVQIDAVTQTIQWSGGSAPSAGSSGKDVYTFTLLKTGTGTTDYQVFGAATNYA